MSQHCKHGTPLGECADTGCFGFAGRNGVPCPSCHMVGQHKLTCAMQPNPQPRISLTQSEAERAADLPAYLQAPGPRLTRTPESSPVPRTTCHGGSGLFCDEGCLIHGAMIAKRRPSKAPPMCNCADRIEPYDKGAAAFLRYPQTSEPLTDMERAYGAPSTWDMGNESAGPNASTERGPK